jgi:hypothetical protein
MGFVKQTAGRTLAVERSSKGKGIKITSWMDTILHCLHLAPSPDPNPISRVYCPEDEQHGSHVLCLQGIQCAKVGTYLPNTKSKSICQKKTPFSKKDLTPVLDKKSSIRT